MAMRKATKSMLVVESTEKAELRRQRERERAAWRRQHETPEQTLLRREKEKKRAALRRQNEDPIQTQVRLKRDRERTAERRRNELPEQTQLRLQKERERTALSRLRKIQPYFPGKGDVCTNNNMQQFQVSRNDNRKMDAPFIHQTESYQTNWSPLTGDQSATSTIFCSSPVQDVSSNLSVIGNNLISVEPKFLSVLSNYQSMLMTNLATFWKNGQYCDAILEAANSKILVHKLLLVAISAKLQHKDHVPVSSFLTVKFSQGVTRAGLNAFADYMYNGILSLDPSLLFQLQTIAQQLDIKELELLCQNQLLSSDTKLNIRQQKDSCSSEASIPDVSISFVEGNFSIINESVMGEKPSDYFARSGSHQFILINQSFPSENAVNHLCLNQKKDDSLSNNIQNFQTTENYFAKKHQILSQTTT